MSFFFPEVAASKLRIIEILHWAFSIYPKFSRIVVFNQMERSIPTGNFLEKEGHPFRWPTFLARPVGPKFAVPFTEFLVSSTPLQHNEPDVLRNQNKVRDP